MLPNEDIIEKIVQISNKHGVGSKFHSEKKNENRKYKEMKKVIII